MKTIHISLQVEDQRYSEILKLVYGNFIPFSNLDVLTADDINQINAKIADKLTQYLYKEVAIQKLIEV